MHNINLYSGSAVGSKMDSAGEGSKSSKEAPSKPDMKNKADIDDNRDARDLIVDDDIDDDKLMDDEVEEGGGRLRVVREQERRYANNARERYKNYFWMHHGH